MHQPRKWLQADHFVALVNVFYVDLLVIGKTDQGQRE
jgi:hypothetical protein